MRPRSGTRFGVPLFVQRLPGVLRSASTLDLLRARTPGYLLRRLRRRLPSPGGRGRASGVTCTCIFFVEWTVHCLRLGGVFGISERAPTSLPPRVQALCLTFSRGATRERPQPRQSQPTRTLFSDAQDSFPETSVQKTPVFAAHAPAKKMLVQVTRLDRPLPPGEGRGEGSVKIIPE